MKSKPVDDFNQLLDTTSGKLDAKRCHTARQAMRKTASAMGGTPKEVLSKLLQSGENSGNGTGKVSPEPPEAPATPSEPPSLLRRIATGLGF